jgi:hypothetical protein
VKLPASTVMYNSEQGKVLAIYPLAMTPYTIQEKDLEGKGPKIQSLYQKIVKTCKENDRLNGPRDGRYYTSMSLVKEDWETIISHAVRMKEKNKS